MDDLVTLLERTTPSVDAPDVRRLTRRARARRGRRWAAVVIPLVALTASAVALRPVTGRHLTTASASQPVGTWHLASAPPIDLTSQVRTAALSTGQLVVVSGSFDVDMPVHKFETALYDAGTDQWTRLADAPVSPPAGGADLLVAGDRVLLLTHDDAGEVSLALFDGQSRQWRAIAMANDPDHGFEGWAWDGATLVLARFGYTPYGDPSAPAAVERWNADTNTWRQGAAPPAAARFLPTIARTNDRLAFWGGYTFDQAAVGSAPMPVVAGAPTTVGTRHDPARRAFTDGAIYDIEHDAWTYLAPQSSLTAMATNSPAGILTSSTLTLVSSPIDDVTRIVARYENGSWRPLPSPSVNGAGFSPRDSSRFTIIAVNDYGPMRTQYLDGTSDSWHSAPGYELTWGPTGLISTSATMGGPGDTPFSVWRLDGTTWTPAVPAPFSNRMEPGIGVIGNQVMVIGGQAGPNLDPQQDAWVLDLPPAQ
jgi:hypothetical protein